MDSLKALVVFVIEVGGFGIVRGMLFSSLIFFVFMPMVIVENGGGRMRAAWASEVFMDGWRFLIAVCLTISFVAGGSSRAQK